MLELMRAVLARGQAFRFRAGGWSMTPFIRDGDVVTITPLGSGGPRLGDVVAYAGSNGEKLVVHRAAGRQPGGTLMLGDNLRGQADGVIGEDALLGRVSRVERNGKQVRLGLGPERGLIALFSRLGLIPVLLRARGFLARGSSG